jgi:hypothetical protein
VPARNGCGVQLSSRASDKAGYGCGQQASAVDLIDRRLIHGPLLTFIAARAFRLSRWSFPETSTTEMPDANRKIIRLRSDQWKSHFEIGETSANNDSTDLIELPRPLALYFPHPHSRCATVWGHRLQAGIFANTKICEAAQHIRARAFRLQIIIRDCA